MKTDDFGINVTKANELHIVSVLVSVIMPYNSNKSDFKVLNSLIYKGVFG